MEHICTRCARLGLTTSRLGLAAVPSLKTLNARGISTSPVYRAGEPQNPSSTRTSDSKPGSRSSTSGGSPPHQQRPAPGAGRPSEPTIRRVSFSGPGPQPNPGGPVLRRTRPPVNTPGGPNRAGTNQQQRPPPPGQLLRRTGPRPGGRAGGQQQGQQQRGGGPPGAPRVDKRLQRRDRRRESEAAEEEDNDGDDLAAKVETYVKTVIDPPENPTEETVYSPGKDLSIDDLRADWPNTPISATGLTETVQQRIEWLAHRIPHGYQTPGQLADRYFKGHLTRFESEAEKEKVLALAAGLAARRADEITERRNVEVQPWDMSMEDVASRPAERQNLADTYVRGKYPELEKQKMPFLDQIVRNLDNNSTYHSMDTKQFMETVQKFIASQGGKPQKGA